MARKLGCPKNSFAASEYGNSPGRPGKVCVEDEERNSLSHYIKFDRGKPTIVAKGKRLA